MTHCARVRASLSPMNPFGVSQQTNSSDRNARFEATQQRRNDATTQQRRNERQNAKTQNTTQRTPEIAQKDLPLVPTHPPTHPRTDPPSARLQLTTYHFLTFPVIVPIRHGQNVYSYNRKVTGEVRECMSNIVKRQTSPNIKRRQMSHFGAKSERASE